jgi:signal transduction histidine kinase
MKRLTIVMVAGSVMLLWNAAGWAAPTKADAEAMVKAAATYLKANGKEKSMTEFSNANGSFVKGELYLMVVDFNCIVTAHGANAKLIGKSMLDIKDSNGKEFCKEFVAVGKKGSGWVDYKWTNPASKKIESKKTYLEAVGDVIIGAGVYE